MFVCLTSFSGEPYVGKSCLINSIVHAFEAWQYYHEASALSAPSMVGTYDLLGPIQLLDRRCNPARPVLELYDSPGFPQTMSITEQVELIGDIVTGVVTPGTRLIGHDHMPILTSESNRRWD